MPSSWASPKTLGLWWMGTVTCLFCLLNSNISCCTDKNGLVTNQYKHYFQKGFMRIFQSDKLTWQSRAEMYKAKWIWTTTLNMTQSFGNSWVPVVNDPIGTCEGCACLLGSCFWGVSGMYPLTGIMQFIFVSSRCQYFMLYVYKEQ